MGGRRGGEGRPASWNHFLTFEGESPGERAGELQLAARKKNKMDRGAKQSG